MVALSVVMPVTMIGRMAVVMAVPIGVAVRMAMVVVAVAVIGHMAAVGSAFRLERQIGFHHGHVHAAQQIGQHMVGLNLQMVGLQLDRDMAVAQVVRGAHQIERRSVHRAGGDVQHFLRCRQHTDQRSILGHQYVAAAHCLAARQKDCQLAALAVGGSKAALLAHIPVQLHGRSAFEQGGRQALALGQQFVGGQHGEFRCKKDFESDSMTCMSRDDFQPFPAAMPPWHSCGADHVAVYGTLREGGSNDIRRFQPGIAQVGTTWLQGSLWDMGQWPGLQLDGCGPVLAEVYPLHPALEQQLDQLEDIWPQDLGQYRKRLLTQAVQQGDGLVVTCRMLVYEALPQALARCPRVPADDWLAWFRAGKPQG